MEDNYISNGMGVLKTYDQQLQNFRRLFRSAPTDQLDESLKERVIDWSDIPTAIEILNVLDYANIYSLASEYTISILEVALKMAILNENTTMEDVVAKATWRD